ncbi:MAG: hypothetical protein QOH59_2359 [Gemmatimonadales bacterium]|nr:hypothetical protein [Gemmatimonadales bacterium]
MESGGAGGNLRPVQLDRGKSGELWTQQDRAEDAALAVCATTTRHIHVGAIAGDNLVVGVEQQCIDVGQARAAAQEEDEEKECTEAAGSPKHARSVGVGTILVHSEKLDTVH